MFLAAPPARDVAKVGVIPFDLDTFKLFYASSQVAVAAMHRKWSNSKVIPCRTKHNNRDNCVITASGVKGCCPIGSTCSGTPGQCSNSAYVPCSNDNFCCRE